VNIVKGDLTDEAWNGPLLKEGIRALFAEVRALGGTISGEHGIGYVQQEYLDLAFSNAAMEAQRAIKRALDPQNILNPGKMGMDAAYE
jgi:glycolate oxidase